MTSSLFLGSKSNTVNRNLTFEEVIETIRSDKSLAKRQAAYRRTGDDAHKRNAPALMAAAKVDHRQAGSNWEQRNAEMSGYMIVDIDGSHNPGIGTDVLSQNVRIHPSCLATWISIGGEGVKAAIKIERTSDPILLAQIERDVISQIEMWGIVVCDSTKANGLSFLSHDPDVWVRPDYEQAPEVKADKEKALANRASLNGGGLHGQAEYSVVAQMVKDLADGCRERNITLHHGDTRDIVWAIKDAVEETACLDLMNEHFSDLVTHPDNFTKLLKADKGGSGAGNITWRGWNRIVDKITQDAGADTLVFGDETEPEEPEWRRLEREAQAKEREEQAEARQEEKQMMSDIWEVPVVQGMGCPVGQGQFVEDLLAEEEISVWYGPPGCMKSFVMFKLLCSVSQNKEFLGLRSECPGGMLYLGAEGGKTALHRRVSAAADKYGVKDSVLRVGEFGPFNLNVFTDEKAGDDSKLLIKKRFIKRLKDSEAAMKAPLKLLVIDTLSASAPGNEETNSAYSGLIGFLKNMRRRFPGLHIALVHHPGKEIERGMRGGSSLKANVDIVVRLEVVNQEGFDGEDVVLKTTKIVAEKSRDDAEKTLGYVRGAVHSFDKVDKWNKPITTLTLDEVPKDVAMADNHNHQQHNEKLEGVKKCEKLILETIAAEDETRWSKAMLERLCMDKGLGRNQARDAMQLLADTQAIEFSQGGIGKPKYAVMIGAKFEDETEPPSK